MTDENATTNPATPTAKKKRAKSDPGKRLQKLSDEKFQKSLDAVATLVEAHKAEVERRNTQRKPFVFFAAE